MKPNSLIISLIAAGLTAFFLSACSEGTVTGGGESVAPSVPSGIEATQGTLEDSVLLSWDAVDNAEYYVIYKALDTPETFRVVASRVIGQSYSDTPVSSGRKFYYKVASGNGNKWSEPSPEAEGFALKGTPVPPETVDIPVNEIGQITLVWDEVINADSYNVYRCDIKYGTYEKINTEDITSTTFTDTSVTADQKYYYKIIPVNAYGEGAQSSIISGTALQQAPLWTGPVDLAATDAEYGEKVKITWAAADYAASYKIYRAADNEGTAGEYAVIAENVTALVFEDRDTTLEDQPVFYYYRVAAVSSGGETDCGAWDTGSVDRTIPAELDPPAIVKASKGNINVISVSWTEVSGANGGYTVYRSTSSSFTSPVIVADKYKADAVDGYIYFDDTTMAPLPDTATYYYKVTAWSVSGENEMESGMNTTAAQGYADPDVPGVPVNPVSSMDYDNGTITVSWNAADTWTKRYTVYRSDNGIDGDYNLISENQTETSITEELAVNDGTVEAGVEYFYRIKALNDKGESALTSGKSAVFTLRVPTNLSVDSEYNWNWNCTYTYTVTWTAVKGATGYEVEYYYSDTWHSVTITGGDTTSMTFDSPNHGGGSYPVRIRAVNSTPDPELYSDYSSQVTP